MVRLAKFNEDSFIDGAIEIAAQCGMAAVSISAIAIKAGAPIGSVYHRFDSRGAILAQAWLRVKADFRLEVASLWDSGDTWAGVAGMLHWCRHNPIYARFLLQCEGQPVFFSETLNAELHRMLETEQAALDACFARCALALNHKMHADNIDTMLHFVLIDAPVAIIKPYLTQNRPIPASVDAVLRASHDAVCEWATEKN